MRLIKALAAAVLVTVSAQAADPVKPSLWYGSNQIVVDAIAVSRSDDMRTFEIGAGARLSYDATDRIGFHVDVDGTDTSQTLIETGTVGLRLGVPIGRFRPYAVGTFGMRFPSNEEVFGGGVGIEGRFKLGGVCLRAFAEGTAEKPVSDELRARFVAGLGIVF